ncbi:MAG TPA: flagellar export chaperone FliS [Clostridiales bacterium]|nr:flagellar export chaperone FliS [Clostridiales bacterium]
MTNAHQKYLETSTLSASSHELTTMLYTGALKNLNLAKMNIVSKDVNKAHEHLIKAQNIIEKLRTTLDLRAGGDIAAGLDSLYEYMIYTLINANMNKNIELIEEVVGYVEELRETWKQIK